MLKFGVFVFFLFFAHNWLWLISSLFIISLVWLTGLSYDLGCINFFLLDQVSFFLILLSFWITGLMILISINIWENKNWPVSFSLLCLVMLLFLILSFSVSDFFLFYILFEASLIPIFLLIMGWGYQPERISASYYLLFYTLVASLPMLLAIFWLSKTVGSLNFFLLNTASWMSSNESKVMWLNSFFSEDLCVSSLMFWVLIAAFLVKMPMYLVHLWLPSAHVEAPVAGSMMLAGVLLKLGGYGLIRIYDFAYSQVVNFSESLMVLGLLGGFIASFICLMQTDVKSLVAYSSVAHMAVVIAGLSSMTYIGWGGAIIIMVAHGLCSSGLFSLVGLIYSRLSSRSIILIRGGLATMPLLALWWFLFSIFNMAAPPSSNLAGEVFVFITMLSWLNSSVLIIGCLSFMGAAYSLYLFSATQHGTLSTLSFYSTDSECREHLVLIGHFLFLFLSLFILVGLLA
nr:NADH dehydrogenase subunit 4 [Ovalona pulchella]